MTNDTQWSFEGDYLTACNCDWGCPCNFNARPTQGNCNGFGAWRIEKGVFGATKLDGVVFAAVWFFPGLVEEGNGTAALYVDPKATPEQREAIEQIFLGKLGGGIFEVLAAMTTKFHPTQVADIEFEVEDGKGRVKVGDIVEMESDLLSYPDGTVIRPTFELPHGIEFKTALATNAKRWWVRDDDLLGSYQDKYAAVARVKFSNEGCVG